MEHMSEAALVDKAAPSVPMTPAQALEALAGGLAEAVSVQGTAQELSSHFVGLAAAALAGSVASLSVTDGAPLKLLRADFVKHSAAFAKAFELITQRPVQLEFH